MSAGVALTFRALGRVRMGRVAHRPPRYLLPLEPEARLLCRTVDNERQAQGLAAMSRVKCVDLDVLVRECLPASTKLCQYAGSIPDVEHRLAEHFPVGIARVRVIGVFDRDRPAIAQ